MAQQPAAVPVDGGLQRLLPGVARRAARRAGPSSRTSWTGTSWAPSWPDLNPPYLAVPAGMVVFSADYKWLALAAVSAKGARRRRRVPGPGYDGRAAGPEAAHHGPGAGRRACGPGCSARRAGVAEHRRSTDLHVGERRASPARSSPGTARPDCVTRPPRRDRRLRRLRAQRGHARAVPASSPSAPSGRSAPRRTPATASRPVSGPGAALDLMDDAWWGPAIPLPGQPYFCLAERTLPGGILVNAAGRAVRQRGRAVQRRRARHVRQRHPDRPAHPGLADRRPELPQPLPVQGRRADAAVPRRLVRVGRRVTRPGRSTALAAAIGVPAGRSARHRQPVQRPCAGTGKDTDFRRGDSAYDHYYTDPAVRPNSCLAPLWLPPFYAFKIVPGDLGTKGGLRHRRPGAGAAPGRLGDPRPVRGGQRQRRGDGPQLRGRRARPSARR